MPPITGGWLSFSCPHGVVYVYKHVLRAESVRDFADVILSMKVVPNILIYDYAWCLAAHVNKRTKQAIFTPHGGRLAEPTSENIQLAKSKELTIHLRWLVDPLAQHEADEGGHPMTGSADR